MGVLLVAPGLSEPSTLWMRRQLDMIGSDVACLFDDGKCSVQIRNQYRVKFLWPENNRLFGTLFRYINILRMFIAGKRKNVTSILFQYATTAANYNWVITHINKPVFIHCHGYDVTWDGRNYNTGTPIHSDMYIEKLRQMPEYVSFVSNSKRTSQRLMEIGINENRIKLKYLGVDIPETLPPKSSTNRDLVILFLGRLVDFKGPDLVIRAFEIACERGFSGQLIIAGDGPIKTTCQLLQAHSPFRDKIKLFGVVDAETGKKLRKMAHIFTAHNCLGPISRQEEAFGVSIVEAMADGIPVVSTNNGSIPELIENGISGIMVEPEDIYAHAEALLKLQSDPSYRFTLAENAWLNAKMHFSISAERSLFRKILQI